MAQYVILILIVILIWLWWSRPREINLDANATTEPYAEVLDEMSRAAKLGNPSSYYAEDARQCVERLKAYVLDVLNKPNHICIITSGASESNNLLFRGFCGRIIYSGLEHKTSLRCAEDRGNCVKVGGEPHPDKFHPSAGDLVSVMAVNNETGNFHDIRAIAERCHAVGAWFHSDMAQFFGKYDRSDPEMTAAVAATDCISISLHKLHGPVGIGFLIVPRDFPLKCQIAGTQNNGLRGGTINVAACAGAYVAIKKTLADRRRKNERLKYLRGLLKQEICKVCCCEDYHPYLTSGLDAVMRSQQCDCLTRHKYGAIFISNNSINTILVSFVRKDYSDKLISGSNMKFKHFVRSCNVKIREQFAKHGVKVSIGSACNTAESSPSHVLTELYLPFIVRAGVLRFSLADTNTEADVREFGKVLKKILV